MERIEELIEELEKLIRRDARARCELEPGAGDAVTRRRVCFGTAPRKLDILFSCARRDERPHAVDRS